MRTTVARLLAAGVLSTAAVAGTAASASATNGYEPTAPQPSVSSVPPAPSRGVSAGASAASSTGAELAYTGTDVLPWAAAGTALVLGGAGLVVAARRKPARSH
ncbi:hypothetical protein [Kineococcus gypseus]|uniref:hypothetical protein n=1 Tax=Kineococcus gypseus TaxID=1637102 RepID=UPI003D7CEB38